MNAIAKFDKPELANRRFPKGAPPAAIAKTDREEFAELVDRCSPVERRALCQALATMKAMTGAGFEVDAATTGRILEESGFAELCRQRRAAA